jgi:hypothetical protein
LNNEERREREGGAAAAAAAEAAAQVALAAAGAIEIGVEAREERLAGAAVDAAAAVSFAGGFGAAIRTDGAGAATAAALRLERFALGASSDSCVPLADAAALWLELEEATAAP